MDNVEPDDLPDEGEELMDAALSAYGDFQAGVDQGGLDTAISLLEASVERTNHQHPEMSMRLNNLFVMLKERNRGIGDIERAIEICEVALGIFQVGNAERPSWISALAIVKWRFYGLGGGSDLLDDAITLFEELINSPLVDDGIFSSRLSNLSLALTDRYQLHTKPEDINDAIRYATKAMDLTPKTKSEFSIRSSNLGRAIIARFEVKGEDVDLDKAILATKAAVDNAKENDPHLLSYKSNLANMLLQRYRRFGRKLDFDEASKHMSSIAKIMSPDSPEKATFITSLADLSELKYDKTGQLEWLEDATQKRREAITITPGASPVRLGRLNNLAVGLIKLHGRTGNRNDLYEGINLLRGVATSAAPDRLELPRVMSNLSNALAVEYQYEGEAKVLDEAIKYARMLADEALGNEMNFPGRFNNLATKLVTRHERFGDKDDIIQAVQLLRDELRWHPRHPERAGWLTELAIAIEAASPRADENAELDITLALLEEALNLSDEEQVDLPTRLSSLANRLSRKYEKSGNLDHLTKAIDFARRAVRLSPSDSPDLGSLNNNLGYALELFYRRDVIQNVEYLENAIDCFTKAWRSESAVPFHRVMAASRAIKHLGQSMDYVRGANLGREVIDFLPTLSSSVADFDDRQYAVSTYTGIAANTCSMLLALGNEKEALENLERGRNSILRELQDSRAMAQLQKYDKSLTERFHTLRTEVNSPLRVVEDPTIRAQAIERRKEAVVELQSMIKNDINDIPGFSQFKVGHSAEEMQKCAIRGPIVFVNVSDISSDAIIVTPVQICVVSLPLIKSVELQALLETQWNGKREELGAGNRKYKSFLIWLWKSGVKQIMAEIAMIHEDSGDVTGLPRVCWIGSGYASALPFHAAGDHQQGSTDNVLSKVVSSYASSTRLLMRNEETNEQHVSPPPGHILIASMSKTPGFPDLPKVLEERALIRGLFDGKAHIEELEAEPTASQVEQAIQMCRLAHLACHGHVNHLDLSKSGLVFQNISPNGDPEQDILSLQQLVNLDLQFATLAYLSACSTAENRFARLVDESLTVVSGFQIAGFKHVIGCLWASFDDICQGIAGRFYANMLQEETRWEDTQIATAFHNAVVDVKNQFPRQPLLWAQFVHFGN